MKRILLFLIPVVFICITCSKNDITLPPYDPETNLQNTIPIQNSIMKNMEGIYSLQDGNDGLGSLFVCKVSRSRVSFFSDSEGIFIILKYGFNPDDSSIQFAGFWRYSENAIQGKIGFSIAAPEGALSLLANSIPDSIVMNGLYLDEDFYSRSFKLKFARHFSPFTSTNDFVIFAHHGVQTTANPPYAENSLDALINSESYGVNGFECDVRMTADNIPICIHDVSISTRLTLKGPLSGNYDQYSFSLLSQYVRLIDGQKIPSVEEMLHAFVSATNLKYMWLDIKGNKEIFKYLEPLIRNAYAEAASLNRDVLIITDLTSKEVIDDYNTQPSFATLPTMCELTLQDVIDNDCQYWAPRFSEGLLLPEVDHAHSLGIKVFSWTLNDRNIILSYLTDGSFDGFITDYPAYAVYYYYTLF